MRREVCARFLRITDEHCELLGSQRDEHFILHLESCYCMKYNSHVRTVNLSSSSALRWTLAPAADSSSWTQLVRNSFTRFCRAVHAPPTLLAARPQTDSWGSCSCCACFGTDTAHELVGDKFLELDGSRVHVINTVDDIECASCVIQTRSNLE